MSLAAAVCIAYYGAELTDAARLPSRARVSFETRHTDGRAVARGYKSNELRQNTSTVALPVVRGVEKGTQCPEV
jgi:hypothetical protein